MAVKTHPNMTADRPGPQGLWGFFWLWTVVLILAAACGAPAVQAQAAPPKAGHDVSTASAEEKVFGEGANLSEGQAAAAADALPKAQPLKPAYMSEDEPLQLKDYEDPKPAAPEPWWQQLLGFVFKLVMVIGLIGVSLAVVKKLSGGRMALNLPNTKGRNIVVLESTHLNPQQAIHMISLGGERLLVVGASPQGLNTLTEITDPHQVHLFLQAQKSTPAASTFNQVFDLERVVQDSQSDLLAESFAEVQDDPRYKRRGWPGQ